jgi:hypothetical protein
VRAALRAEAERAAAGRLAAALRACRDRARCDAAARGWRFRARLDALERFGEARVPLEAERVPRLDDFEVDERVARLVEVLERLARFEAPVERLLPAERDPEPEERDAEPDEREALPRLLLELRFDGEPLFEADRVFDAERVLEAERVARPELPLPFSGMSTPAWRASDSPIAMACLAFFAPCLPSRM